MTVRQLEVEMGARELTWWKTLAAVERAEEKQKARRQKRKAKLP